MIYFIISRNKILKVFKEHPVLIYFIAYFYISHKSNISYCLFLVLNLQLVKWYRISEPKDTNTVM